MCCNVKIDGFNSILREHSRHSSVDSFITISYCTVTDNIQLSYKHSRIVCMVILIAYRSLTTKVGKSLLTLHVLVYFNTTELFVLQKCSLIPQNSVVNIRITYFNNHQIFIMPTECIYGFSVTHTVNSDHFVKQD